MQNAERSLAFTSGMAALTAVVRLFGVGDHILAGDDLYGGTSRLLTRVVPAAGVEVTNVDTSDLRCGFNPPCTLVSSTLFLDFFYSTGLVLSSNPLVPHSAHPTILCLHVSALLANPRVSLGLC